MTNPTWHAGGGTNSGVNCDMLTAGKSMPAATMRLADNTNMYLNADPQSDFRNSIIYNSNNVNAWEKIRHLNLRESLGATTATLWNG